MTHENWIDRVRRLAAAVVERREADMLMAVKLVYGSGRPGIRGTTFFGRWNSDETTDLVEIAAFGEQSPLQLAGTTLHELAHVLAGWSAGHGARWKAAARRLGLIHAKAASQHYVEAHFSRPVLGQIQALASPSDGWPAGITRLVTDPPCTLGFGTRGGTSRGAGSGSRLRLFLCGCHPPVRVRVARNEFQALCLACQQPFSRAGN